MKIIQPSIFTTGKIAKLCSVSIRTVARWIESDQLKAFRLPGESTEYRVTEKNLLDFLKTFGLPYEHIEDEPTYSILVADDDAATEKAVKSALKSNDVQTTLEVASDMMSAAIQVGLLTPFLFVINTEINDLDSLHLLEVIKAEPRFEKTNIIALIGNSNTKIKNKLKKLGVETILSKPVKSQTFKKEIGALLV